VLDIYCATLSPISGLPVTLFLGALGWGGATAWFGLTEILNLQRGQSLIVNGAAGSVQRENAVQASDANMMLRSIGSLVVQIAKHILGAGKVVAIAGSNAKCRHLEQLGADIAM
jgi:NADPH-dependent curcumin reductase CurA